MDGVPRTVNAGSVLCLKLSPFLTTFAALKIFKLCQETRPTYVFLFFNAHKRYIKVIKSGANISVILRTELIDPKSGKEI